MRILRRFSVLAVLSLLYCSCALADLVVVVDAKSGVDRLTQDEVINIFLGRYRKLPTGVAAIPVDQPLDSGLRGEFYRKLVNKDLAEINAYWARLYFSGKTTPPIQATSAAEVLARVVGSAGGIGYIEKNQVDARVRIVWSLSP
jgi:ABC-type phosphate transport system substrate-binding protein